MLNWIENHETLMWWLGAGSLVAFVITLVAMPIVIIRLPADYFVVRRRWGMVGSDHHPVVLAAWKFIKSLLGLTLIVIGIPMLVLPGQGVITILIGIMLLDFPGKYRLQQRIVSRPGISRSINWLRSRAGQQPFSTPQRQHR